MGFSLIGEDTLYKKVETPTGVWNNGVYVASEASIEYVEVAGLRDPYSKGETSFNLPEGVGDSSAYLFYSDVDLKVHKSLPEGSNLADILYFESPDDNSDTTAYAVYDKMDWSINKGFSLIEQSYEYLIVQQGLI